MKRIIAVIMILSILFAGGSAASFAENADSAEAFYKDGLAYYEKGDYSNAYPYFRISGDVKNYAPAQNMLGVCYRDGSGTAQDLEEAEKYFKLAADQGDADAKANLAELATEKEKLYREATALFLEEKYEEAKSVFEMLGNYEFSKDFVVKCEEALQAPESVISADKTLLLTDPDDSELIQAIVELRDEERELKEAAQLEIADKRIVYIEVTGGGGGDGGSSGRSTGRGRGGGSGGGGIVVIGG